jgi:hypothetical protein
VSNSAEVAFLEAVAPSSSSTADRLGRAAAASRRGSGPAWRSRGSVPDRRRSLARWRAGSGPRWDSQWAQPACWQARSAARCDTSRPVDERSKARCPPDVAAPAPGEAQRATFRSEPQTRQDASRSPEIQPPCTGDTPPQCRAGASDSAESIPVNSSSCNVLRKTSRRGLDWPSTRWDGTVHPPGIPACPGDGDTVQSPKEIPVARAVCTVS